VNVSRLAGIKYEYDPGNFFRRNSNIPPKHASGISITLRGTAHVAISRKEKFRRGFSEGNRSSLTPYCLLIPSSGYVVDYTEAITLLFRFSPLDDANCLNLKLRLWALPSIGLWALPSIGLCAPQRLVPGAVKKFERSPDRHGELLLSSTKQGLDGRRLAKSRFPNALDNPKSKRPLRFHRGWPDHRWSRACDIRPHPRFSSSSRAGSCPTASWGDA
jgi:Berberine and berberine like